MDEWTHFDYDAGGNAVSHDRLVGPRRDSHLRCYPGISNDVDFHQQSDYARYRLLS
jgi:hypothetical protein